MSKFNTKTNKVKAAKSSKKTTKSKVITNLAGGVAYSMKEKTELVTLLLTSFVADSFYEKSTDVAKRVKELIAKINDKEFVAKTAVYARNEFGMRSISHVVAGLLATEASIKGQEWTKEFFNQIVRRVDDMLEIVSFIQQDEKAKIPNSLKKGFAKAFNRFDTYQLSKYQANNAGLKLVDLVNIVHPIPTARNKDGLNALINGKLKNLTTSQTALTDIGQKAENAEHAQELRKGYWTTVLTKEKLGYIDLVRSLTKIAKDAPEAVDLAVAAITNKEAIKKSLVFPYQLYISMKMVEKDVGATSEGRKLVKALADAVDISCDNVPEFGGKTVVVVDRSGSMDSPLSNGKTDILKMSEVGTLMALFLARKNDTDFVIFGDEAKYVPYNPQDSVLTSVKTLLGYNQGYGRNGYNVGHGTNFHSVFQTLKGKYDRIIIFSDMQGWVGHYGCETDLASYKARTGANPFVYSHDLRGHGSLQIPEEKTFVSAGFSEKIFDVMKLLEQDKEALVNNIQKTVVF